MTIPRGQRGQASRPQKRVPVGRVARRPGPGTGRGGTCVMWVLMQCITLALEKAGTLYERQVTNEYITAVNKFLQ